MSEGEEVAEQTHKNYSREVRRIMLLVVIILVGIFGIGKESKKDEVKKSVEVVAFGDVACEPGSQPSPEECRHPEVAKLIDEPEAVLVLGDVQYQDGAAEKYKEFDKYFGRLKNIIYPIPGNHDYETKDAAGYFNYFNNELVKRGYYSFDISNWHVVGIDSNMLNRTQLEWLEEELKNTDKKCVIAMAHHPRFSSGREHGSNIFMRPVWELLAKYKVEILLAGHEHNYERFWEIDGVRQFVVGTGGRNLYYFGEPVPGSQVRIAKFGVLELELEEEGYKWRFVDIENQVKDEGEGICR